MPSANNNNIRWHTTEEDSEADLWLSFTHIREHIPVHTQGRIRGIHHTHTQRKERERRRERKRTSSISHVHADLFLRSSLSLTTSPSLQYQCVIYTRNLWPLSSPHPHCLTLPGPCAFSAQLPSFSSWPPPLCCGACLLFLSQHLQHHPTLPPLLARIQVLGPMTLSVVPPETHRELLVEGSGLILTGISGETHFRVCQFPGPIA